jgi:hypothetical protein
VWTETVQDHVHTTEQKIVRPTPVSGFPEWLPEVRIVEQHWSPGLDDLSSGLDDEMAGGLAEWIITAPGGRQIALRRLHRDADNGLAGNRGPGLTGSRLAPSPCPGARTRVPDLRTSQPRRARRLTR